MNYKNNKIIKYFFNFILIIKYVLLAIIMRIAGLVTRMKHDKFFTQKHNNKKYVIRENFIVEMSKNKRVLHFGFLDYPFTSKKLNNETLLHTKIKKVSTNIVGVDIDENSLNEYRKKERDNNNILWDIEKDEEIPSNWKNNFDLIIFGEILEHLKNPQDVLKKLKNICDITGSKAIITVPNIFSPLNIAAAIFNEEIVHPDHYYYFSPFTIKRLLISAKFREIEIILTGNNISRIFPGLLKPGLMIIAK